MMWNGRIPVAARNVNVEFVQDGIVTGEVDQRGCQCRFATSRWALEGEATAGAELERDGLTKGTFGSDGAGVEVNEDGAGVVVVLR
mmetsp:Transcript_107243/g.160407  ORF Transcript_107243/g.160407 Transcript_107243/m.160407 type:complete len:86 (-) Transcript_107243:134-391(-)